MFYWTQGMGLVGFCERQTGRQAGEHLIYPFYPMLANLIHECPEISLYFLFGCFSELL